MKNTIYKDFPDFFMPVIVEITGTHASYSNNNWRVTPVIPNNNWRQKNNNWHMPARQLNFNP